MRHIARAAGLALCLLVLLTTCSAPMLGRAPVISSFGAVATPALAPTVLPTVTPALGVAERAPDAPPLSAVMAPASTGQLSPELLGRAAQMDAYLAGLTQQGAFSGAALVAYKGQVLLSRGYGLANREQGLPAGADTRFRLASVTKPITAIAVLRLAAAGKLALGASICEYLSPCPPAWQPVTVTHLLGHSSGIADLADFANFALLEQLPTTPDQLVARFRDMPLAFTPGSLYDYSNSNYVLLALIIERAAGQPYADHLRDEIFAPLGMADTGLDPGDFGPLEGTRGYAGGAPDIPLDVSNLYGAGDLYSTVGDLHRLALALDAGALLPPDLAALMAAPGNGRYGLGWMVEQRGPHRLVYHPGSMSGAATWFGRYPDAGLTVIVLSNDYYVNVFAVADELARYVLG